jgi:uncharacterized protein (DUF488 family)
MRIYTLGTDHRPEYEFTRILAKHGIQVVFDVRRMPESREPHFRRDRLQTLCTDRRIDYIFLGNELGGPRDGDFRAWVKSEEFRRWIGIIRNKLEKRVCCILCAEHDPERCHRRNIGDELARQGVEVVHLLDESTVWQPPAKPARPETGFARRRYPRQRPGPRPRRR